jgi:hypothetical protein
MIRRGLRLDPTRYPGATLVSTRCHEQVLDHEGTIPPLWRPRLSDLLPLLQGEEGRRPAGASRGSGQQGGFLLRPLEEGEIGAEAGAGEPDDPAAFRVVGLLAMDAEEARAYLADCSRIAPDRWIRPRDLFGLMTKETAQYLKRIPAAVNLSSAESLRRQAPIVSSERFGRAAREIWKCFLKPECTAALLKGVAGVGKSCLIRGMAGQLAEMAVPSRIQGLALAALNTVLFMPSSSAIEEAEKSSLRAGMASRRVVWVIDEASRLVDRAGNTAALDSLLLFIDQGAKVVLLSDQSYLLEKREAFIRRLTPVYLPAAEGEEVAAIALSLARHLGERTGLTIRPEAVREAVTLSSGSAFAQPHAVVDLLTGSVASAEVRGEGEVTRETVRREVEEHFSQGSSPARLPETGDEVVRAARAAGFRGHDGFLREFGRHLARALRRRLRPDRPPGPVWASLLVGAPGIGKTMLLKIVGKLVTGAERKVLEVQCSSFQKEHAIQSLIGSPMSYVGYGEGGLLQNFAKQHPDGVVILEKPELGHANLLRLISEILGGSFTAGDGQVISTRRLMVFVTSTVGADGNRGPIGFAVDGSPQQSQVRVALEEALGPALLGQIGWSNIFRLEPLEPAALRNILRLELHGYGRSLGLKVAVEEGVLEKVVNDCAKRGEGARAVLDEYRGVIEPLLDAELEGGGAAGGVARLRLFVDANGTISCRAELGGDGPEAASPGDP